MVQINLGKIKNEIQGEKKSKNMQSGDECGFKETQGDRNRKDSIKQEGGGEKRAALCNMLKGGSCLAGATFGIWITKQDSLPSPLGSIERDRSRQPCCPQKITQI